MYYSAVQLFVSTIHINCRSQVRTAKRVLLIFIVDYFAQGKEYGIGTEIWEGKKGQPLSLALTSHGTQRALSGPAEHMRCSEMHGEDIVREINSCSHVLLLLVITQPY